MDLFADPKPFAAKPEKLDRGKESEAVPGTLEFNDRPDARADREGLVDWDDCLWARDIR